MNMTSTSKKEFLDLVRMGTILPIYREITAQGLTPLAALEALRSEGFPVIFESSRVHEQTGRYSFVTADPYLIFKSYGDEVEVNLPLTPAGKYGKRATMRRKPLQKLQELLSNYRTGRITDLPPFTGGAIGFISYDFAHQFKKLPKRAQVDLKIPESFFIFVDMVVAFDHILNRAWVVVNAGAREQELGFSRPNPDWWDRYYDEAVEKLEACVKKLESIVIKAATAVFLEKVPQRIGLVPKLTQIEFESMVMRCKEYITAGDIYQANLSQRFSATFGDLEPLRLYNLLREFYPSQFGAYLDFGELKLVSFSPERLIRLLGRVADTGPIADAHGKLKSIGETKTHSSEHYTNEDEQMEHLMLFDLEQNDLRKVCERGSVTVEESLVEDNSHIKYVGSNIRGFLEIGKDGFDLIRAVFPAGMVTGVPKLRCMEIIDEVEPVARGPYTGSIGYISNSGDMDFNVTIRTFVIKNSSVYLQIGARIVADSDPAHEYAEIFKKAETLRKLLERS